MVFSGTLPKSEASLAEKAPPSRTGLASPKGEVGYNGWSYLRPRETGLYIYISDERIYLVCS